MGVQECGTAVSTTSIWYSQQAQAQCHTDPYFGLDWELPATFFNYERLVFL